MAPLAEVSRKGSTTTLWGDVRDGSGACPYRLQRLTGSGWRPMGGVQRTRADGTLGRVVLAAAGVKLRLLVGGTAGNVLVVR